MRRQWQTKRPRLPAPESTQRKILPRMTSRDEDRAHVTGYMCAIDWQHEIGNAKDGNRVYPSIAALKANHAMWEDCGIVEVEVAIIGIIAQPKD